jgi:DNA-binding response OmpR family regulator
MSDLALIIEDDPDLSYIFSEALQAAEYETQVVLDGQEARRVLRQVVPKLIVLDMHLPNVSGGDLLYLIRNDARLKDSIVMIATADARMAETYDKQADYSLIKPIAFNQLRDLAVRLHLEQKSKPDDPE